MTTRNRRIERATYQPSSLAGAGGGRALEGHAPMPQDDTHLAVKHKSDYAAVNAFSPLRAHVGALAKRSDIRQMTGRLFIERDPLTRLWQVLRYVNEDRGTELVSRHATEQAAEAACRKRLFPPPPEIVGGHDD